MDDDLLRAWVGWHTVSVGNSAVYVSAKVAVWVAVKRAFAQQVAEIWIVFIASITHLQVNG